MVYNLEGISRMLNEAFENDGIKGLRSCYVIVINGALENNCSIDELKNIKVFYDELYQKWEKRCRVNIDKLRF